MTMEITLDDLEIRYNGIKEKNPKIPKCSKIECKNPIDWAGPHMGWDTSCAYHRLLFDYWIYEIVNQDLVVMERQERRIEFDKWIKSIGQEKADEIVLMMANEKINWMC